MKVYAAWNKDNTVRMKSTSGGVFSILSEYVLESGGYVCGAILDYSNETPVVKHIVTNSQKTVELMRGSKYVQSDLGNSFLTVKELLLSNNQVLFSGTPCQVAGLKRYLGNNTQGLITVDILCHGVSSPLIFENYCQEQQDLYKSSITDISFRFKKPGWIVFSMKEKFANGKEYISDKFHDKYLVGFLNDMYARRSCQICPYTSLSRQGDFTLADFWGYKSETYRMRNDEKGISIVLVNTENASDIWQKISTCIKYEEHPIKDILDGNRSFQRPWDRNIHSESFWDVYHKFGWKKASELYCLPGKLSIRAKLNFWVYKYWFLIPKFLIRLVKKMKR